MLTAATTTTHGNSQLGDTAPIRFAAIMREATMLAAAKKGASWAREIS
jgi:hypothetical protein